MTFVKHTIAGLLVAASLLAAPLAAKAAGPETMVDGQVTEVRPNAEFTIKHGPIPNLEMGAMTMVFRVKDPMMAKGIKKGDRIRFHVEDLGGKLTITKIDKAK